jgi:transposase
MSSYSEDLRRRVVSAVEGAMSKAQAARTFSVSLSSVKLYANKAKHGESLAPKKRPGGSTPILDEKARSLLSADLEERPYLTLRQQHCDYIEAMTGLSVSRSTMWSAIARIGGSTRKKGDESPPSATSS